MRSLNGTTLLLLLSLLPVSAGCYSASGPAKGDTAEQEQFWTTAPLDERIAALKREINAACPAADPAEVTAAAATTIRYGELLAEEYDLSRPPEHHNIKVRLGLKERGLCFELADDLYVRLHALRLRTLELHSAITKPGHLTEEHNVVIISGRGRPMETGVVLDLWRYAGKARFLAVAKDHHQWIRRDVTYEPEELVVDDTGLAGKPKVIGLRNGARPAPRPASILIVPATQPVRAVSRSGR